ncbi:MAG: hypothetical protein IMZ71_03735 [Chloroflexi bacterium]|nr:hypothetical protein [Chloroflexota bacterium]
MTCKKQITFKDGGFRGARFGVLSEEPEPRVLSRRVWYCPEHYLEMRRAQREQEETARREAKVRATDASTAVKIGRLFHTFEETLEAEGITDGDVEKFRAWCGNEEAVGPLLNPTLYSMGHGFEMLEVAKARVEVLRELRRVIALSADVGGESAVRPGEIG